MAIFSYSYFLYELFKLRCETYPEEDCISYRRKNENFEPYGEYQHLKAKECLEQNQRQIKS